MENIDWTKGIKRANPDHGGELPVTLRGAIISAVNLDGTVDLDINGAIVPNQFRVYFDTLTPGDRVQVLAHLDGFLVLGPVATSP